MQWTPTRGGNAAELLGDLVFADDGEKDAIKDGEMVAAVSLVQQDLPREEGLARPFRRAVKDVDLGPLVIAGDFRWRKNNRRMLVVVSRVDADFYNVPLLEFHRWRGAASSSVAVADRRAISEGLRENAPSG